MQRGSVAEGLRPGLVGMDRAAVLRGEIVGAAGDAPARAIGARLCGGGVAALKAPFEPPRKRIARTDDGRRAFAERGTRGRGAAGVSASVGAQGASAKQTCHGKRCVATCVVLRTTLTLGVRLALREKARGRAQRAWPPARCVRKGRWRCVRWCSASFEPASEGAAGKPIPPSPPLARSLLRPITLLSVPACSASFAVTRWDHVPPGSQPRSLPTSGATSPPSSRQCDLPAASRGVRDSIPRCSRSLRVAVVRYRSRSPGSLCWAPARKRS